ncbi:MAG: hemerythrin domain-containing protein, partial [Streptosporangiaceae bacterium]
AAIDELTREHDVVVGLISEVRAASAAPDVPRMAQLARRIAAVLGPHTQVEENGLFPAMEADFPEHMAALRTEHRHVEAVLAEASTGTPADPGWPARLTGVLGMLRQHILKEQDGVFPAALAGLSTSDWEAVENVRVQAGSWMPAPRGGGNSAGSHQVGAS